MPKPNVAHASDNENWFLEICHLPVDLNPCYSNMPSPIELSQGSIEMIDSTSAKPCDKSAYQRFYKRFVDIMERADSNNEHVMSVINNKFSEMSIEVLKAMNKNRNKTKDDLHSFPQVEKHSNRKRLAPPSSPKKRR